MAATNPGTMSIRRQRAGSSAISFFETHEAELEGLTRAKRRRLSFGEAQAKSYASLRSRSWPALMKMVESSDAVERAQAFVE